MNISCNAQFHYQIRRAYKSRNEMNEIERDRLLPLTGPGARDAEIEGRR